MKTIEVKVYSFNELSELAKEKAIEKFRYLQVEDINWWEFTYTDAEEIGLKITSFDLDRNKHATGEFILSPLEVAQNILNEHGETCETYQIADNFLKEHAPIYANYMETEEGEEELQEIEESFLNNLLEEYANILQNESEYLTSNEGVIEFIEANQYEFTEDGNQF